MFEIGMVVIIVSTGMIGVITAIRRSVNASDNMQGALDCDINPKNKLPDYVELDGEVQVHPSRVEKHEA